MAFPDFVIIRVVRWRDLHGACSEFFVDNIVCHDRQPSVNKRMSREFPVKVLNAFSLTDRTRDVIGAPCNDRLEDARRWQNHPA